MTVYSQIASNKRKTILLIVLFIIFIVALGYIFDRLFAYGYVGLFFAIIIALLMALLSYYSGDKLALWTAGAKGPITKEQNSYIYNLVENLAITAGLPMPKVYLIPDSAINALATGRDPKHSSVAITQGAIEKLENEELEGVIAHELSHIKNYDIRLMMVVIICVGIISLIADWFWRAHWFAGHRSSDRRASQADLIFIVIGLSLAILSPLIANLIRLAVSRKREYLADASAVLLTRYPDGLIRALEKIGAANQPLRRANHATAHLYISDPFGRTKKFFSALFSTHPPIAERIKALKQLA